MSAGLGVDRAAIWLKQEDLGLQRLLKQAFNQSLCFCLYIHTHFQKYFQFVKVWGLLQDNEAASQLFLLQGQEATFSDESCQLMSTYFSTCKVLFLGFLSFSKGLHIVKMQFNSVHSNVVWAESENLLTRLKLLFIYSLSRLFTLTFAWFHFETD